MPEITYTELDRSAITPTTLADLNSLLSQLSPEAQPITLKWLERIFNSGTRIFAAKNGDNGRIIGTVLLCSEVILVGQKDWIEDLVVDKAYQGQGVASHLMDMAEQASRQGAAKHLNLTSNNERTNARNMYIKRGYELRNTGVFRQTFEK